MSAARVRGLPPFVEQTPPSLRVPPHSVIVEARRTRKAPTHCGSLQWTNDFRSFSSQYRWYREISMNDNLRKRAPSGITDGSHTNSKVNCQT
jgi:hypothetical protein